MADPVAPADATKVVTQTIPPITVSMIGTGTGDGGGVAPTPNGTILHTPDGQPNIVANVVSPIIAIIVRFINVWLTVFSSLAAAAGVGGSKIFAATDLKGILITCAWAATIAAGGATVKNLITVFGRLEGKYPLSTGSI